jgi:beta-galactosidase
VAFIQACHERGLRLLVRPGPQVNGELTGFGYPWRVLSDARCQARGARNNPVVLPVPPRFFPVPSYASERFFAEARRWLEAVGSALAPYQWPQGPVVAAQVDNEACFFFRTAAYDQDYHPDAIARFGDYLSARYGSQLPAAYGGVPAAAVDPPRSMNARGAEELVPHLDWLAFKEQLLVDVLARMARVLGEAGLDRVPLLHNLPATEEGEPFSVSRAEGQLDLVGLDLHPPRRDYCATRRAAQLLAGSSRLPWLAELGWGGWPWWLPQTPADQLNTALAALMHGVKGFNLYMGVERDRWYGAPISAQGRPQRDQYELTRQLVAAVRQTQLGRLQRRVEVALMQPRDYRRLARCCSLLDPLPPMGLSLLGLGAVECASEETFGFEGPVQIEQAQIAGAIEQQLTQLRVPYHLVDSDAAVDRLQRYRLLLVPTFDFIDRELLGRLGVYAASGGTLAIGPRRPRLDGAMQPLEQPLPPHALLDAEDPAGSLEGLVELLGLQAELDCDDREVELARYRGEDQELIFVANRAQRGKTVVLGGVERQGHWFWDALTGDPVDLRGLVLEAGQVRMLRSRPREAKDRAEEVPAR